MPATLSFELRDGAAHAVAVAARRGGSWRDAGVPASMQCYDQAGAVYCELRSPTSLTAPLNLSWPGAARNGAVEQFVEFVRNRMPGA